MPRDLDPPPDLDALLQQTWRALVRGVPDERHGFHWPVVATVDERGAPQARVCVLRSVSEGDGQLTFQTDRRSPKVRELRAEPRLSLTFHDRRRRLQLRVCGAAKVHLDGPLFDAGWSRCGLGGRRSYLGEHEPSSRSDDWSPNLPPHLVGSTPTRAESEAGRERFAVVEVVIHSMDLLVLARSGHRRVRYTRREAGGWGAEWLQP